jgi:hypothetical protein
MAQTPLNDAGGTAARVAARLSDKQHQALTAAAARRGVTVSSLLRLLVDVIDRIDLPELANSATGPPGRGG